jgi:hypothetical protein
MRNGAFGKATRFASHPGEAFHDSSLKHGYNLNLSVISRGFCSKKSYMTEVKFIHSSRSSSNILIKLQNQTTSGPAPG